MDFSKIRNYLFLGGLLIVTILFFYLIRPLAYPVFWAAVIAGMFHPLYRNIDRRLNHKNLSALLTLVMVSILIIIPLTIIASLFVQESGRIFGALSGSASAITSAVRDIISTTKSSFLAKFLNEQDIAAQFTALSSWIRNFSITNIKNFTQITFSTAVSFVIMLYTLFFFLRDGERLLKKLVFLLPLGDRYEELLFHKFMSTSRAALKGNLLISVIQGIMTTVLFLITGIPGAIILGIFTVFASLFPGLGSALVWFPVGILALLLGHVWQGITILVVGTLVIGTIDNLLRPIFVGKDSELHPLLIFFSTIGGIIVFGLSGFIIGPIISALFLAFWQMYEEYYHEDLSKN